MSACLQRPSMSRRIDPQSQTRHNGEAGFGNRRGQLPGQLESRNCRPPGSHDRDRFQWIGQWLSLNVELRDRFGGAKLI